MFVGGSARRCALPTQRSLARRRFRSTLRVSRNDVPHTGQKREKMGGGDASPVRCQSPIENGISPTTTISRRDRCEADTGIGMNGRVRSVDSLDQGNNSSYTLSQLRTVSFSLRYICSKEEVDSFRYMTLNITSFLSK